MEKSAVQYIQWRYQEGVDKEQALKANRALTDEEKELLKTPITGKDGTTRFLEDIVGRQKLKKSYNYEIKWQGLGMNKNSWLPRERLIDLGFTKLVQQFDDFEASREGAGSREMSLKLVRQHLMDVGLDGDIAEYNEMRGLSGGQKVKVVIAAAMWSKPQCLILDEPTNFLDRDALGGLAVGIREWTGAFLCISHNQEFVNALCGVSLPLFFSLPLSSTDFPLASPFCRKSGTSMPVSSPTRVKPLSMTVLSNRTLNLVSTLLPLELPWASSLPNLPLLVLP